MSTSAMMFKLKYNCVLVNSYLDDINYIIKKLGEPVQINYSNSIYLMRYNSSDSVSIRYIRIFDLKKYILRYDSTYCALTNDIDRAIRGV